MSDNGEIARSRKRKRTSNSNSPSTSINEDDINNIKKDNKKKRSGYLEKESSIYATSNLEVISGGEVRFTHGRDTRFDTVRVDNLVVPKLKKIYATAEKYKQPTSVKELQYRSPDEVLTEDYKFEPNELVYLSRDEIEEYTKVSLPDPDITNAIHYYVANRIKERLNLTDEEYDKNYSKFLDGSALLALGALVTKWVGDCAGDETFKTHMQKVEKNEAVKLSSIDEFIRVYDSDNDDNEEEEYFNNEIEKGDNSDNGDDKTKVVGLTKKEESSDSSGEEEEDEIPSENMIPMRIRSAH